MPNHKAAPTSEFADLVAIVKLLRSECPWDKEQTHHSVKDLLLEEAYEAVDAIDHNNWAELKKELGDLLLHVVFHAVMASEQKTFDVKDVIFGIQEKLIRRHPHVFATTEVSGTQEVLQNWETIKMKENGRRSVLDGVPASLPSLLRAERIQEKAGAAGFQWPDAAGAWVKFEEEIQEFKQALEHGSEEERRKEFGDVLFSLVNIGRYYDLHPEESLRLTNNKFQRRFSYIEEKLAAQGKTARISTLEELDALWDEAKGAGL
jgi:XTP/dITP diphosphohydrolase